MVVFWTFPVSLQSFIQCESHLLLKPFPCFHRNLRGLIYLSLQTQEGLQLDKHFSRPEAKCPGIKKNNFFFTLLHN